MQLAFTSGPYSAPDSETQQKNIDQARKAAEALWAQGFAVICPHLNSAWMDKALKEADFLAGCLEMLRRCDVVFALPGWERSPGARAELSLAMDLGIPIEVWKPDESTGL